MSQFRKQSDRCCIVIKAQPHRSSKYFETVCCAGIGEDAKWRRQYPVPFRVLKNSQKFTRWDWIEYDWVQSERDKRQESQKVDPASIKIVGKMTTSDRRKLLNPLVRKTFAESDERRESLTLIRPNSVSFRWKKKTDRDIDEDRQKHAELSRQLSFFDSEAVEFDPCSYSFRLRWTDQDGAPHDHEMDDWETIGAYSRFESAYGEPRALEILKRKYEEERFGAGLVLAFSTHKRRNITVGSKNQWLLVGLLSLEENQQSDLFIS